VRTLRENAKMSRTQLAEKADLNARTIEAYEQGRKDINNAKIKTLLKLCIALGCRLEDILTDDEAKELLKLYENSKEVKNQE